MVDSALKLVSKSRSCWCHWWPTCKYGRKILVAAVMELILATLLVAFLLFDLLGEQYCKLHCLECGVYDSHLHRHSSPILLLVSYRSFIHRCNRYRAVVDSRFRRGVSTDTCSTPYSSLITLP
jgi:hypothetical protein